MKANSNLSSCLLENFNYEEQKEKNSNALPCSNE